MTDSAPSRVLVGSDLGVGHLTLNRPEALNALDHDMVVAISAALDGWRDDPDVQLVLIDGAGERGLCAGGDVRGLAQQIRSGDPEQAAIFFRAEYAMNARIAEYAKPVVALADGVTMGGGVGLAGHAAIRVVTERSKLAMPETRIGFTPDVGGTWLLGRAPGRVGEYLGVTGMTMDASDAIYAGFADHFVPSDHLASLVDALQTRADPTGPTELVLLFDETPEPSRLEAARPWIDDAFSAPTLEQVVARLHARPEPEAAQTAELMAGLSPTGMAVTLESVRRAREAASVRDVLAQEYGVVMWFVTTQPDLPEGVRAQLIDKDRSPRWQPASIADLPDDLVETAFGYTPQQALWE